MDTSQYLSMFLEESMDNLQALNESLLQLEQEPENIDKVNEIFRVAHTLKGMAATMGYSKMAELTHKMEDVLSRFRDGDLNVTQEVVTVLFTCLDKLEQMVDAISEGNEEGEIEGIIKELESLHSQSLEVPLSVDKENKGEDDKVSSIVLNEYDISIIKQVIEKEYYVYEVNIPLDEKTLLKSARAFLIVKALEDSGDIIKIHPSTEDIENENFDLDFTAIYVTKKTDNEVYELIMGISEVASVNVKFLNDSFKEKLEIKPNLEQVARTTSDLQDLVMKIRMLPLDTVFNRFPRMVRDLSVELDKEMELIIEGQETELDRTVIDEIGEPLIHLIRNAADHGIESQEERDAAGKNPVGKIKLIAYQEGTKAVIKVQDDGAGINVDKIKAKAERVGISTEGMNDNDIKNLIFNQGFSTNEEVTDISGRGVGMDVVKTKIAALGGTVDLISEVGEGSSFIIRLPLTLQIIQALLVKVGSETMAISLGYVNEIVEFKEEDIKKTNNQEVIIYRGAIIPLIRINEKLDIESQNEKKGFVVIVKVGEKTAGILVDSLMGQQEIVIKPLGKILKNLKQYIGATILGDGLVTLILDIAALI